MSIWTWVGLYFAFGYAALGASLVFCDQYDWRALARHCRTRAWWQQAVYASMLVVVFLLLGPLMPLFYAHGTWQQLCRLRQLRPLTRKHREAVMDPIAFNRLPDVAKLNISCREEKIESAGFEYVNTFLVKPEPFVVEQAYYLSEDGRTLLSIGHVDETASYSFMSLLSDGMPVETGVVECFALDLDRINSIGKYVSQLFTLEEGADLEETLQRHQDSVNDCCQQRGVEAASIGRTNVRDVVKYTYRRFSEVLYLLDDYDDPPPKAIWPLDVGADESGVVHEVVAGVDDPSPLATIPSV